MSDVMKDNNSVSIRNQPAISVVMPVRNEKGFIARSIGAVLQQDYPKEKMEVIVVDGMSDDGTRDIVQKIIGDSVSSASRMVLLDNPSRIVPAALNIGLIHAQGEVIIRVDGHCEIPVTYVRQCVDLLESTKADCVGGLQYAVSNDIMGSAIALATSSPFGVGNAYFRYATKPGWMDTVYLGAYRRTVFTRIGKFDEELIRNQDDEFNFRLIQAGGKIWFDPALCTRYHSRSTFTRLWKQYFQYGFYKVRVIQKRKAIPSFRHIVPLIFVLAVMGGSLLSLATKNSFWIFIVTAPYVTANVIFSGWVARRNLKTLFFLPLTFAIIHISYGMGFLAGLWHFRSATRKTP